MIPQADVVDRLGIVGDVVERKGGIAGDLPFFHLVEVEGPTRRRNGVFDIRPLLLLLVRRHHQPLHERRHATATDKHDEIACNGGHDRPGRRREGGVRYRGGTEPGHDHEGLEDRQSYHDVDIRCPMDDPGGRGEHPGHVQIRPGRQQQKEDGDERREVLTGLAVHLQTLWGQRQLSKHHIRPPRPDQGQDHDSEQEISDGVEERQSEDVETRVSSEQRIEFSKRCGVEELQEHEPLT